MSRMACSIADLVSRRDYVSFAELSSEIPGFYDPASELAFERRRNLVLWTRLTPEAVGALQFLIMIRKNLWVLPCAVAVYLADGRVPELPIAKYDRSYTKPRWWPAMMRLAPQPRENRRAAA